MGAQRFINYYEVLDVVPSASPDAIERSFRSLARRYHPDNQTTGNRSKFDAIVEAHDTLRDAAKRARYHDDHIDRLPPFWQSVKDELGQAEANRAEANRAEANRAEDTREPETFGDGPGIDRDMSIQDNLLTLLYLRRRRNIREPGIGDAELERLSGCPAEHLEFHIWYLKAKGWVATGEDGLLAITIDGVDRAANIYRDSANRLITNQS